MTTYATQEITTKDARLIGDDIRRVIEDSGVLKTHGLTIVKTGGSIGDTFKLTVTLDRADANGHSAQARAFLEMVSNGTWLTHGLTAEHLGATVMLGLSKIGKKQPFTITGYKWGASKFPLAVTDAQGNPYMFELAAVAQALGVYKERDDAPAGGFAKVTVLKPGTFKPTANGKGGMTFTRTDADPNGTA
jgi:hypothetical protein